MRGHDPLGAGNGLRTPHHHARRPRVALHPDLPQDRDRRQVVQHGGRGRQLVQQPVAVPPHLQKQGRLLLRRQAVVRAQVHVLLLETGGHGLLQPRHVRRRQRPHGQAQRFRHRFERAQLSHRPKHGDGVGALLAPLLEEAQRPHLAQDGLEDQGVLVLVQHALPEVAQAGVVEARVPQRQVQGVRPVQTHHDLLRRLAVGDVLQELEQRDHRQQRGRARVATPRVIQRGELRVVQQVSQVVADDPIAIRRCQHLRSHRRDIGRHLRQITVLQGHRRSPLHWSGRHPRPALSSSVPYQSENQQKRDACAPSRTG
jgi:hypothetical protein